ncbi:MAG: hypothetical protein P8Q53_00660, partial [Flavobacteriaceae bacterium]|nr:hypothetical protein [Flavobacteriaceae bacterium]
MKNRTHIPTRDLLKVFFLTLLTLLSSLNIHSQVFAGPYQFEVSPIVNADNASRTAISPENSVGKTLDLDVNLDQGEYLTLALASDDVTVVQDLGIGATTALGSNSYTGPLLNLPSLTIVDTDNDGVNDVFDLDDDNDGVPDTIENFSGFSSSTILWLDASDSSTITDSGGKVSLWKDKSGNGNHARQNTSANQPTSISGVITFDGSDDYLELPHGVIPDPTESSMVFMVGLTSASGDGFLSNGRFGYNFQSYSYITSSSNMKWYSWGSDLDLSLTTPYTNLSIHSIDLSIANSTVKGYQNGILEGSKT